MPGALCLPLPLPVKPFRLDQWHVDPASNTLTAGTLVRPVEPLAMAVLVYLYQHADTVVSPAAILDACWPEDGGTVNALHKSITQLRRALNDDSVAPRYIATIRKRGYRLVAEHAAIAEAPVASWLAESPFRGLDAFDERHAAIFFGRQHAIAELVRAARAQIHAGCALVLLLGPSGSGKTSLVRAGFIPAWRAAGHGAADADALTFDGAHFTEANVWDALGSVLLDAEVNGQLIFAQVSAAMLGARLRAQDPTLRDQLQAALGDRQLVVFIDRFEALFRLRLPEDELAAVIAALDFLARCGPLLVILACRNEFYPAIAASPTLMAGKANGGHVDLARPSGAELAQMIRLPARMAGLQFDVDAATGAALDDVLVAAALATPDMLPSLQHCLQELYRQRRADGTLRHDVYAALGGLEGALGTRAEAVFGTLAPEKAAALPRVLAPLVHMTEASPIVSARRARWSMFDDDAPARQVVQAFVDTHLFVSDLASGVATFGVTHEALLRRWPRAAAWIATHHQLLQEHARLAEQVRRWDANGRRDDFLLPRGLQANQARALRAQDAVPLTDAERAFIDASWRQVQRSLHWRLSAGAAVVTLALLATGFGIVAQSARRDAEQRRLAADDLISFMLGDFVDQLRPLGKLNLLDSVSTRALTYLAQTAGERPPLAAVVQRIKALHVISEVKWTRADIPATQEALAASHAMLQDELARAPQHPELLKLAGANAFWQGRIVLDQRQWDAALTLFEAYRDYSDRYAAVTPDRRDGWMEQAHAHSNLGTLALKRANLARAEQEFRKAIDLGTRALDAKPDDKLLQADLADSLSWLGTVTSAQGQLPEALQLFERQVTMLASLQSAAPEEALWQQRQSVATGHIVELLFALGESRAALDRLRRNTNRMEILVQNEPTDRRLQKNWRNSQFRLLNDPQQSLDEREFERRQQEIKNAYREFSRLEPTRPILKMIPPAVDAIRALRYLRQGQPALAAPIIRQTLAEQQPMFVSAPSDAETRRQYVASLLLAARIHRALRDDAAANGYCEEVIQVLQPSIAGSNDYRVLAPWVLAHTGLGRAEVVAPVRQQLADMGYRDETYLANLDALPPRTGRP